MQCQLGDDIIRTGRVEQFGPVVRRDEATREAAGFMVEAPWTLPADHSIRLGHGRPGPGTLAEADAFHYRRLARTEIPIRHA